MPFEVLLSEEFVIIWCAVVTILLLGFILWLRGTLSPVNKALESAITLIEPVESREAFCQMFNEYDASMVEATPTASGWKEYRNTLILPESEDLQVIRAPFPPSHWLNENTLVAPGVRLRLFASLPGLLTAIGILGTFVGLAAGISVAAEGLSSGKQETVTTALQNLLSGASLAFVTSIAGLIASLIFLVFERVSLSKTKGNIHKWTGFLSGLVEPVSLEEIAIEHRSLAKEQSNQLKKFNDDLVVSLEEALDNQVAKKLTPQLEKLVTVMESIRAERSTDGQEAIKNLVEEFTRSLNDRTGSEFDSLAKAITEMRGVLEETVKQLAETSEKMQTDTAATIGEVCTELKNATDEVSGRLTGTGESLAATLSNSAAGFASSVNKLSGATTTIGKTVEQLNETSRKLTDLKEVLDEGTRGLRNAGIPIENASTRIEAATASLNDASIRNAQNAEAFANSTNTLVESQDDITKAWIDYCERYESIDSSLSAVFSQLTEGLGRYTDLVKTFVSELDGHTAAAIQNLGAATQELNESVEALSDAASRMRR